MSDTSRRGLFALLAGAVAAPLVPPPSPNLVTVGIDVAGCTISSSRGVTLRLFAA